ncbi:SHOCT domain-containing protein [Allokutzneria albata]|uniref:Putative membrane protein n=1 Tax=Allokutzneria albata TaxID=211114 RepID=A0A1G9VKV5_ALLAB|nr:SHOCT domain-containing protein [Allokutzneria albata]SDM72888.1 putative membrane protein [Allokutzneria albata]
MMGPWYGPEPGYSEWGWPGFLFMIVSMVVFWGGLLAVVLTVLRHLRLADPPRREAERILAERLARGEIDEEEYRHRRETLGGRR